MSTSKKQPLRSLPQLPATPRWAPSTPHAIRALQQRSGGGARRKSANRNNRSDSARSILRQLARVAAKKNSDNRKPSTSTSTPANKENAQNPFLALSDDDLEDVNGPVKPDFTLPINEGDEDEDGDNTGLAPTRRELPGGDDYTFKSIDFAAHPTSPPTSVRSERVRRVSRASFFLPFPDPEDDEALDNDGELTVQSIEYGRRAVSEGPGWDRYPRSSFGSIRMSEFGLEESRIENEPMTGKSFILDDHQTEIHGDGLEYEVALDPSGETGEIDQTGRSMSESLTDGLFVQGPGSLNEENTSRLDFDQDNPIFARLSPELQAGEDVGLGSDVGAVGPDSFEQATTPHPQSPGSVTRQMTEIEASAPTPLSRPRQKKLKLTRRGNTVPALPSSLIKRVAIDAMTRKGAKRPAIPADTLAALEQATEWFFEQIGEDLEAYSNHAKRRKKIDVADVWTLMRRQRVIGRGESLEDLAQEFLPDEVCLNLDFPEEA